MEFFNIEITKESYDEIQDTILRMSGGGNIDRCACSAEDDNPHSDAL